MTRRVPAGILPLADDGFRVLAPSSEHERLQLQRGVTEGVQVLEVRGHMLTIGRGEPPSTLRLAWIERANIIDGVLRLSLEDGGVLNFPTLFEPEQEDLEAWLCKTLVERGAWARDQAVTTLPARPFSDVSTPSERRLAAARPFSARVEDDLHRLRPYPIEQRWGCAAALVLTFPFVFVAGLTSMESALVALMASAMFILPVFMAAVLIATTQKLTVKTTPTTVTLKRYKEERLHWANIQRIRLDVVEEAPVIFGVGLAQLVFTLEDGTERHFDLGLSTARRAEHLTHLQQVVAALRERIPQDRGSAAEIPEAIRQLKPPQPER